MTSQVLYMIVRYTKQNSIIMSVFGTEALKAAKGFVVETLFSRRKER